MNGLAPKLSTKKRAAGEAMKNIAVVKVTESIKERRPGTVHQRNSSNSVIARCEKVAPGYFSYVDKHSCLRGPFSAERMQQWYEKGFFADDFEVFAHRGRVADHFTLGKR
nr:GYF domain containing protein [Haemonchus contortus]